MLPERVIAGAHCGFGTFAGHGQVQGDVAGTKARSLVEGARRAARNIRIVAVPRVVYYLVSAVTALQSLGAAPYLVTKGQFRG